MYKGHDRAIVGFRNVENNESTSKTKEVDEVVNYLEARYVSATESCYRLFAFELHANLPHVIRLALHLQDKQPVIFGEHADLEDVLSRQRILLLQGGLMQIESLQVEGVLLIQIFQISLYGIRLSVNGRRGLKGMVP